MSGNGTAKPTPSRLDEPGESGESEEFKFPPKPAKARYVVKVEYATERVIAWQAIQAHHSKERGYIKERDKSVAIPTRNAVLYGCEVDRATTTIGFAPGWMVFQSGEQIDHLLKCFAFQLSDDGPGIELEFAVIAEEIIAALKVIAAKAEADKPVAEKPKSRTRRGRAAR